MSLSKQKGFFIAFLLFLTVVFLLSEGTLLQGADTRFRGKVIDHEGKPVEGAKITLISQTGRKITFKTNEKGEFFQRGINPGPHKVVVEKKGYRKREFSFVFRAGVQHDMDIPLSPASVEEQGGELYKKGIELYQNNEIDKAIEEFLKLIEEKPDFGPGYFNLGTCYLAKEDYPQAEKYLTKALEFFPDNPQLFISLSSVYIDTGRPEKAEEMFQQLVQLSPTAETYFNIGVQYYNNQQPEKAVEYFQKTVELNPEFSMAYYDLGLALVSLDKLEEAVEVFEKYLELEPDTPEALEIKQLIEAIKKSEDKEPPNYY
ncbi:MAG: tetratricopeptide repeat protein [Acidobacteriota bacterium]